ncbi:expressed unknown protein [Seminavis robusta]|uniref:Uncharacterized protein n=1 Tax=Seminavis robusta TaxID=568900 RepID=A0A9N8EX69_9STRA|nr:expressed unknown protein [Seminavis robusta]|eukprot:Sro1962_g308130.1 n/a (402) ;mRNA; f:11978-13462
MTEESTFESKMADFESEQLDLQEREVMGQMDMLQRKLKAIQEEKAKLRNRQLTSPQQLRRKSVPSPKDATVKKTPAKSKSRAGGLFSSLFKGKTEFEKVESTQSEDTFSVSPTDSTRKNAPEARMVATPPRGQPPVVPHNSPYDAPNGNGQLVGSPHPTVRFGHPSQTMVPMQQDQGGMQQGVRRGSVQQGTRGAGVPANKGGQAAFDQPGMRRQTAPIQRGVRPSKSQGQGRGRPTQRNPQQNVGRSKSIANRGVNGNYAAGNKVGMDKSAGQDSPHNHREQENNSPLKTGAPAPSNTSNKPRGGPPLREVQSSGSNDPPKAAMSMKASLLGEMKAKVSSGGGKIQLKKTDGARDEPLKTKNDVARARAKPAAPVVESNPLLAQLKAHAAFNKNANADWS